MTGCWFAPVGSGSVRIHLLQALEFVECLARREATGQCAEPGLERELQAVGEEGHEDVRLDAVFFAVTDRAHCQVRARPHRTHEHRQRHRAQPARGVAWPGPGRRAQARQATRPRRRMARSRAPQHQLPRDDAGDVSAVVSGARKAFQKRKRPPGKGGRRRRHLNQMGWLMGLEPTTTGITIPAVNAAPARVSTGTWG